MTLITHFRDIVNLCSNLCSRNDSRPLLAVLLLYLDTFSRHAVLLESYRKPHHRRQVVFPQHVVPLLATSRFDRQHVLLAKSLLNNSSIES